MSRKLHPKVAASTTAGAASIVLVWLLAELGVDMPDHVAQALTVLLASLAGYLKAADA